ncbi:MAG: stilbene synthase, partial [Desulfobacterales bacterium]|nr:stilbene synthase [Desulfobacterales bacterium]
MTVIRIQGVGTAVSKYVYDQAQVRQVVEGLFHKRVSNLDRLLRVFDHLHIARRHFARDPKWYAAEHGFAELNQLFIEAATELSCEAARIAMAQAG